MLLPSRQPKLPKQQPWQQERDATAGLPVRYAHAASALLAGREWRNATGGSASSTSWSDIIALPFRFLSARKLFGPPLGPWSSNPAKTPSAESAERATYVPPSVLPSVLPAGKVIAALPATPSSSVAQSADLPTSLSCQVCGFSFASNNDFQRHRAGDGHQVRTVTRTTSKPP